MNPLAVTIAGLRAAAQREESGAALKLAHRDIDAVERLLWRERIDWAEPVSLTLVKQAVSVEFALWALQFARHEDKRLPDLYGRHMAVGLIWDALSWLCAAERTYHELTHAHLKDMMADLADRKVGENHYRWIGWLELLDEQAHAADGNYAGRALLAAVWCGQSIVAPAPVKRDGKHYPTPRKIERLGRRCAYAAYDNLMYAWVTATAGFRAAHEVADEAARWEGRRNVLCDARLGQYADELRRQADKVLEATVEKVWRNVMEGVWK